MKKFALIISLLLCCVSGAMAQKYVIDYYLSDSVEAKTITLKKNSDGERLERADSVAFCLYNGDVIEVTRTMNNEKHYAVFIRDGKEYAIDKDYLLFADDNAEGVADLFGDTRSEKGHSAMAHFCSSTAFLWTVSLALVLAMVLIGLGLVIPVFRPIGLIGVPVLMTIATILEFSALCYIGNDAFWWCDPERYGFWGSMWRLLPYVIFVCFQIYLIWLYAKLITKNKKNEEGEEKTLSLKPIAIAVGLSIPLTIVVCIILSMTVGKASDSAVILSFLGTLSAGLVWAGRKNVKEIGLIPTIIFSIFSVVYFFGVLVMIYGIILIVYKMIMQVILYLLFPVALAIASKLKMGEGSSKPMTFRDDWGREHVSGVARDEANKKIRGE